MQILSKYDTGHLFLIANLPVGIGVRAQVDPLADTVDLPHGIFPGEIKYFHGEFKAAHINGCEGFTLIRFLTFLTGNQ